MWIAFGIIGGIAMLILAISLLPVKVIIKNDRQNNLILRYRFLFKTYGEDPDPNDPVIKMLKTATGADRLELETVQKSLQEGGLKKTVTQSYAVLIDLLKELVVLLRLCTVRRLHVNILCTGSEPDEAAIHYGECCAATSTLLGAMQNFLKLRKRNCKINIGCDFGDADPVFRYDVLLVVRFGRVLASFWRVAMAEAKRKATKKSNQQK